MRQSNNVLNIEGIVSEKNIRDIEKNGKKYICGDVIVEVEMPKKNKEGKEEMQVLTLPVSFISANTKADGSPNKNYIALQKLNDFDTIASSGRENATRVQIRGARIRENSFVAQNDNDTEPRVIRGIKLESNFFTRAQDATFVPSASYNTEVFILDMKPESKTDAEGVKEETGRLIVTGAVGQWGDTVDVVDFIAEDKPYVDFINQNWKVGDTVQVGGYPKFIVENIEKTIEAGFGEAEVKTYSKRTRELIITRGSREALDDEHSFAQDDIKAAMTKRKAKQDEMIENAKKPKESAAKGNGSAAATWDNF